MQAGAAPPSPAEMNESIDSDFSLEWRYLEFQAELQEFLKVKIAIQTACTFLKSRSILSAEGAVLMFVVQLPLLPFLAVPYSDIESP